MRGTALALALGLAACDGSGPERHSALLVTLDTTRADALSCYGNPEETTPALDALAAEGVLFEAAHTVMALTLPAHTSMLTGLAPPRHGLRDNGIAVLPGTALTVAEQARAAGFDTAAFVSSVVLDDDFGLQQGFEVYSSPARRGAAERAHGAERPAAATVDAALEWLARRPDGEGARPFFLWVHLYDPHHPYAPRAEFAGRFSTPYLGEVAQTDQELGRLLADLRARGLLDDAFVLVLADHGEAFGEHGEVTHGSFCYEPTLRIPMIARWPGGRRAGERSDEIASAVDVAPTLAEAMGLPALDAIDGLSFYSRPIPPDRGFYFESYYAYLACGWSPLAGWLDARGKYVHSSEPEFYDWRADPLETRDLARERPGELERYRRAIAAAADAPALAVEALGGDGESLTAIAALGYAGGEGAGDLPHPLAETGLPSPRSQAGFFALQARAQELTAADSIAEAAAVYEGVLRDSPTNYFAMEELGGFYLQLGRAADAVGILTRLAAAGPPRGRVQHKLGLALVAAGRLEDAVEPLAHAVELTGGRPRYLDALREVLAKLGREGEMEAIEARYRKVKGG